MFSIALFSPLGPQTGSGAVPELPQLRDTPRHSGAGPETLCIIITWSCNRSVVMLFLKSKPGVVWVVVVFFSSTSILLGSWKLQTFLRLINASMKEAAAKRPLLKDFIELEINDFPVPADSGRSPQPAVALQIDGFLKDFN